VRLLLMSKPSLLVSADGSKGKAPLQTGVRPHSLCATHVSEVGSCGGITKLRSP